jgi:hypothetical protein
MNKDLREMGAIKLMSAHRACVKANQLLINHVQKQLKNFDRQALFEHSAAQYLHLNCYVLVRLHLNNFADFSTSQKLQLPTDSRLVQVRSEPFNQFRL